MNETEFIAALRHLPLHPGARGLADDCAVLDFGGEALVLTHDMLVEGTPLSCPGPIWPMSHGSWWQPIFPILRPRARSRSGCCWAICWAAMMRDLWTGWSEVLGHYGVPLLGGDTVAGSGPRAHGLTAIGRAVHTPVPSRAGRAIGDELWLTGSLGAAMLGFESLARWQRGRQHPLSPPAGPAGGRPGAGPAGDGDDGRLGWPAARCLPHRRSQRHLHRHRQRRRAGGRSGATARLPDLGRRLRTCCSPCPPKSPRRCPPPASAQWQPRAAGAGWGAAGDPAGLGFLHSQASTGLPKCSSRLLSYAPPDVP